eukprot:Pgem_evm1s8290
MANYPPKVLPSTSSAPSISIIPERPSAPPKRKPSQEKRRNPAEPTVSSYSTAPTPAPASTKSLNSKDTDSLSLSLYPEFDDFSDLSGASASESEEEFYLAKLSNPNQFSLALQRRGRKYGAKNISVDEEFHSDPSDLSDTPEFEPSLIFRSTSLKAISPKAERNFHGNNIKKMEHSTSMQDM